MSKKNKNKAKEEEKKVKFIAITVSLRDLIIDTLAQNVPYAKAAKIFEILSKTPVQEQFLKKESDVEKAQEVSVPEADRATEASAGE